MDKDFYEELTVENLAMIKCHDKQIKGLEHRMNQIINSDPIIARIMNYLNQS